MRAYAQPNQANPLLFLKGTAHPNTAATTTKARYETRLPHRGQSELRDTPRRKHPVVLHHRRSFPMGGGPHPRSPGGSRRAGPCAADPPIARLEVEIGHAFDLLLKHLPELDGLVVGREEEAGAVGGRTPADLVDLLLNLQTLEVVKL